MYKIVNIFLSISLNIYFECLDGHDHEMVLLSTHNICFS